MGNGAMAIGPPAAAPILDSTFFFGAKADLMSGPRAPSSQVLAPWPPSAFQRSRSRQRPRINGITCSRLVITIGLSVDPTTEDDRCHYDAATAPRPRKTVADPIGIGVRVGVGRICPWIIVLELRV